MAPPSTKPVRSWADPRFIAAAFALVTALGTGVSAWANSQFGKAEAAKRTDFSYDALKSEIERQATEQKALSDDVKALRGWLEGYVARQRVVVPRPTNRDPKPVPTVVVAQPGDGVGKPMESQLPELPKVKSKPSAPALPDSPEALVRE